MIYVILIPALWIAWLIYWNIAAFGNKAVRRRESMASRSAHVIPLALAIVLIAAGGPTSHRWFGWLYQRFLPLTEAGYWIGVAILASGLGFSV